MTTLRHRLLGSLVAVGIAAPLALAAVPASAATSSVAARTAGTPYAKALTLTDHEVVGSEQLSFADCSFAGVSSSFAVTLTYYRGSTVYTTTRGRCDFSLPSTWPAGHYTLNKVVVLSSDVETGAELKGAHFRDGGYVGYRDGSAVTRGTSDIDVRALDVDLVR